LSEPVRAEWASGQRGPVPTALLLFCFGLLTLLIVGVLAAQNLIGGPKGFSLLLGLTATGWGLGAVLLGLAGRRTNNKLLQVAAITWWLPFWLVVIAHAFDPMTLRS
jgi:hypothetical protein